MANQTWLDDKLKALDNVQQELVNWNNSNCPSETGYVTVRVLSGHPLHRAVSVLQMFYKGFLPHPAINHWRQFLRCSRNDDEEGAKAEVDCLIEWVKQEIKALTVGSESKPTNPKRSTKKGDAQAKLIAALSKHQEYQNGSCLNLDPIGVNALARLADVSPGSASKFFTDKFQGHDKYKIICLDAGRLADALKALNGDFAPHELYGRRPPNEGRDEDE